MNLPPTKKRVVGLVRVSTKEQAEDDRAGIARQKTVIERIVSTKGLELLDTVELDDVSGTNVEKCPEIKLLVHRLKKGEIQGIVVSDFDRFIRPDSLSKLGLLDIFSSPNSKLYFEGGEIDLSTDAGNTSAFLHSLISSNELRTFKRRVAGGKEEKRKRGECPSSKETIPTGIKYDRPIKRWGLTPDIVKVQNAFEMVDKDGVTNLSKIGRDVGIHHRTLSNILRNPIYKGLRVLDKERGVDRYCREDGRQADRKKVLRPADKIISVKIFDDPPVSEDRFDRVQKILATKRGSWQRDHKNTAINYAVGVGRCGYCHSPLYCSSGKRRDRKMRSGYYTCKCNDYRYKKATGGCLMPSVRQDRLDAVTERFVAEKIANTDVLKSILSHNGICEQLSHPGVKLDVLERAISKIHTQKERACQLFETEVYDASQLKDRLDKLAKEEAVLEAQKKKNVESVKVEETQKQIELIVRGAIGFTRLSNPAEKQIVIKQLFSEISYRGDEIVGFKFNTRFL